MSMMASVPLRMKSRPGPPPVGLVNQRALDDLQIILADCRTKSLYRPSMVAEAK
jgi:hypothetical protein